MGVPVRILAQDAMDAYYGGFSTNSDFFELDDFVRHIGYRYAFHMDRIYKERYAEVRADGGGEIVKFDPLMLSKEEIALVSGVGEISGSVMSFVYDQQSVGIQSVFDTNGNELERATEEWHVKRMPKVSRGFYKIIPKGIKVFPGTCEIGKVTVYYVSGVGDNYEVPDVLSKDIINETIANMRDLDPTVIKKTNDQNQNKVMETEINKKSLK